MKKIREKESILSGNVSFCPKLLSVADCYFYNPNKEFKCKSPLEPPFQMRRPEFSAQPCMIRQQACHQTFPAVFTFQDTY